jgi:hypothetical protein
VSFPQRPEFPEFPKVTKRRRPKSKNSTKKLEFYHKNFMIFFPIWELLLFCGLGGPSLLLFLPDRDGFGREVQLDDGFDKQHEVLGQHVEVLVVATGFLNPHLLSVDISTVTFPVMFPSWLRSTPSISNVLRFRDDLGAPVS